MKVLGDEIAYEGDYTRLIKRKFLNRHGKESVWEMVQRKKSYGNIVVIAAVTPEQELILEKIFRLPLKEFVLELPAGVSDIQGEAEEDTARRELLEETGYEVDKLERVAAGVLHPGIIDDEISLYLGVNARKVEAQKLDESEEIEVVKVPVSKLLDFIQRSDIKVDIKIPAVLPYLKGLGMLD